MSDAIGDGLPRGEVRDRCGAAFSASPVPLFLIDESWSILCASAGAGRLLGREPGQLLERRLSDLFEPPVDPASIRERIVSAHDQEIELEVRRESGETVPVCFNCSAPDCDFTEGTCVVSLYDLSRRNKKALEHDMRVARLSLLNQVSGIVHRSHLALAQILRAVLIGVTSGEGLGFNRAFLLLIDDERHWLQGEVAIGPSDQEEAGRIWQDLDAQDLDLEEMMISYDRSLEQTDARVNEIVKGMRISMDDEHHLLIDVLRSRRSLRLGPEDAKRPGMAELREWLGNDTFAVAPLTTRRGVVGVVVADNAINHREISDLDVEFLQLLANQSALAIENSRLYFELERRLVDLRQAVQRHKEDQETMLQMERLSIMGETSAIVAHELRNPLVAIGGFGRTLERNLDESDPNHRFARIITEEVARLERIIHDLLDFIRPQKLLRKMVDADSLVTEAVGRFGDEIAERGLSLVLEQDAGDTEINVNPGEIKQVIDNIVLNAMQILDGSGTIEIRTSRIEGGFQIDIADNGPGLPPDVLKNAFAPFFTTKTTGSGLGLTICSQIVKAHGGVLKAANSENGGAVFTLILPLRRHDAAPVMDSGDVD